MPETNPRPGEIPPQVIELLALMRSIIDTPPAGLTNINIERYEAASHEVRSESRIPGYDMVPTHRVFVRDDIAVLVGELDLPGPPLKNGTPTLRSYNIYRYGDVQLWGYKFPHPDRIRTIESEIVAMLPPADEMDMLRNGLLTGINKAVNDRLRSKEPERHGLAVYLEADEIEKLNRELATIARNGII